MPPKSSKKYEDEPKIQEVDSDEETSTDEDMPALETKDGVPVQDGDAAKGKHNRSEKKSRRMIQKLGMKQIHGMSRVTVKKSKNVLLVIHNPEVYKAPSSDTYVVFGEAKIEDLSATQQAKAAQELQNASAPVLSEAPPVVVEEADDEDEAVDEDGVNEKDIDLVVSQVNCTRSKAIKALKAHDGDMVEAIMALSE